jgi:NYN domain
VKKKANTPAQATKQAIKKRVENRIARAKQHGPLANNSVNIFVDDQNLFYGIVNREMGRDFRIDFGRLLLEATRDVNGNPRAVGVAYIAGVIPDDDSFWEIARSRGFQVKRGFLGSQGRSKQDDSYLITEMTAALFEQPGPSTIVLVAGDADYVPPLERALEKGWRNEVAFIGSGVSISLEAVTHLFRPINPSNIQHFTS